MATRRGFSWEDLDPATQARLRSLNPTVADIMEPTPAVLVAAPAVIDQAEVDYLVALKVRELSREFLHDSKVASTKNTWWIKYLGAALVLIALLNARGGF